MNFNIIYDFFIICRTRLPKNLQKNQLHRLLLPGKALLLVTLLETIEMEWYQHYAHSYLLDKDFLNQFATFQSIQFLVGIEPPGSILLLLLLLLF